MEPQGHVAQVIQRYLDLVKQRGPGVGSPVTHENGFIQLSVGEHARLHVWPDLKIAKQLTDSPIHDHTFSFRSWVLLGALDNVQYQLSPQHAGHLSTAISYELHTVDSAGKLQPTDFFCMARLVSRQHLPAGAVYEFGAGEFHETRWRGLTCSLMVKTKIAGRAADGRPHARVLCRINEEPDNAFDRATANPPELLWSIIDQAVLGAEYYLEDLWGAA
jgi:hypothetical protein